MTSNFPFLRSVVGITGALLLAASFVGVAVVPAYAAPIAAAAIA